MVRVRRALSVKEIAYALTRRKGVDRLAPIPDLAESMFLDVDGSLTQTLLKIMSDIESSGARMKIKAGYVDWLLSGGTLKYLGTLDEFGVPAEALDEAIGWMRSEKGKEARRVCARLGRAINNNRSIDYTAFTRDTHVTPFDLRYLVSNMAD